MTGCLQASRYVVGLALLMVMAGCAAPAHGPRWGDATLAPGWERISVAARDAVTHPGTWAPLVVAAGLQLDNADERLSDWARRETPVFGSRQDAIDASDQGVNLARAGFGMLALAAPSGSTFGESVSHKAQGLFTVELAVTLNSEVYSGIKHLTDRPRPDGSDDLSFPSGHASKSSAYANFGQTLLPVFDFNPVLNTGIQGGFLFLAAGTGWARVEGGLHYPSDVLAGYALGNFVARFFNAAFLDDDMLLRADSTPDGFMLVAQWRFR